jgi:hypothetical protein
MRKKEEEERKRKIGKVGTMQIKIFLGRQSIRHQQTNMSGMSH